MLQEPERCPWTETGPGRGPTQLLVLGLLPRHQMHSAVDMRVPAMSHELRLVSQVCQSTCAVPTSHVTRKAVKEVKATGCQALKTYPNKVYLTRLMVQDWYCNALSDSSYNTGVAIQCITQDWCCNTMHHTRLVLQYNASHKTQDTNREPALGIKHQLQG